MKADKIRSNFVFKDIRFNAGYFLNEDAINSRIIERNHSKCQLLEELAEAWNPPIFKRQFCSESERAVPYCQSSDVSNALDGSEVFINKKQAIKVGSIVEEKQILVTGFGTIGNTRLVNELSNGISYANNVCRIKVKDFIPYGYVYAFMTSKYGKSQLNKNASGSVVRYIEAPGIKKTLIPILSEETQQKIHNLIVESAQLRVEANKLLKEATIFFDDRYTTSKKTKYKLENIKLIGNSKRLNSHYFVSPGRYIEDDIRQSPHILLKDLVIKIFTSGRDKRTYVKKILGIPFLSNSEMTTRNPFANCNYLSKKKVDPTSPIKKNYLMTGRVGLIGQIYFPFDYLIGSIASDNIIRIEFKSIDEMHLVYAFFASKIGNNLLTRRKTGVTQPFITEEMLYDIPIPILNKGETNTVQNNIAIFSSKIQSAFTLENQAIDLIEKEIDQWQQ